MEAVFVKSTFILKIIYIAGFGYSGSTLLERILAIHPEITGGGELHHIVEDFKNEEVCSCGQSVKTCLFWQATYKAYQKDPQAFSSRSLFDHSPLATPFLVDASKSTRGTMRRPFQLQKKYEVFLIHLVRDGRDCLRSQVRRKPNIRKWRLALSTALHWTAANVVALYWSRRFPEQYFRIRYEDLVHQPVETLTPLFKKLDLKAESVLDALQQKKAIPLTHQLSGNAIRRNDSLFLTPNSKQKQVPSSFSNRLFTFVAFPMLKWLGYL